MGLFPELSEARLTWILKVRKVRTTNDQPET